MRFKLPSFSLRTRVSEVPNNPFIKLHIIAISDMELHIYLTMANDFIDFMAIIPFLSRV